MKNILIALTLVVGVAQGQTLIRSTDASGVSHVVMKIWPDSAYILAPLRIDTQVTMPSRGGYIARNGTGDTIYYTFAGGGSLAKISFNGQGNNKILGDSGGVWGPVLPHSLIDFSAEEHSFAIIIGDSLNTTSTATTIPAFSPAWSCTIDSIVAYKITGTGNIAVDRVTGGSTWAPLFASTSLGSSRTSIAITGNSSFSSTNEMRLRLLSPSSLAAVVYVYWRRTS